MLHSSLLFLHIASAIIWIGGMFFAYFCLRPAAVNVLEPPQRLALWVAAFRPFLRYTAIAVVLLIATGFALIVPVGFAVAPHGWLAMMATGLVMAAIFGYVYAVLYPTLVVHTDASSWPAAAGTLNSIRRLVAINLVLSVIVIASAVAAR